MIIDINRKVLVSNKGDSEFYNGDVHHNLDSSVIYTAAQIQMEAAGENEEKDEYNKAKQYIKDMFEMALVNYQLYCFAVVGHVNTKKIEKHKNKKRILSLVGSNIFVDLEFDDAEVICFQVDGANLLSVLDREWKFILSNRNDFLKELSVTFRRERYDSFIDFYLELGRVFNSEKIFIEQIFNPLMPMLLRGDVAVSINFSPDYGINFIGECGIKPVLDMKPLIANRVTH